MRRAFWRRKLTAYFVLVNADQSAEDVEECLDYFEPRGESFEGMWTRVQRKYGFVVDKDNQRAEAEEARFRGGVEVQRPQSEVLTGLIRGRVIVMVTVTGIPYKSYLEASKPHSFDTRPLLLKSSTKPVSKTVVVVVWRSMWKVCLWNSNGMPRRVSRSIAACASH